MGKASVTTLSYIFLICVRFPSDVVANYAIGDKDPMCWTLAGNVPMACPHGLYMDWLADQSPPDTLSIGLIYQSSIRIAVTRSVFVHLESLNLLPSNHSADSFWTMCSQENRPCSSATAASCCYFHVNVHSCQNLPGIFCGPWVSNDGILATHTPAQTGFAGVSGNTTFTFAVKLFWQGSYTVIAHFKMGNMHFAVGKTSEVRFSDAICAQPLVPNRTGACEPCPAGTQPLSLGVPEGAKIYSNDEAVQKKVNPLCVACPIGMYSPEGVRCEVCATGSISASVGSTNCSACTAGKFNPSTKASSCLLCAEGTFSGWGSKSCTSCPRGRFRNTSMSESTFGDARDCESCPDGLTTPEIGTIDSDHCTCLAGTFRSPELGGCRSCLEGLLCEGGLAPPKQDLGYYALEARTLPGPTESDYAVFHCDFRHLCAKATFIGECVGNRLGLACSECSKGFYPHKDGTCHDCVGSTDVGVQIFLSILIGAAAFAFIGISSMASPRMTRGSVQSLGTAATVLFMNIQALAAYCSLPIDWSVPLNYIEPLVNIFKIRIDLIEPHCFLGVRSVVGGFGVSIAAAPLTAVYIFFLWIALRRFRVNICRDRLCNAVGTIFWLFFLTITLLAISPLHCLANPGGIMTVSRHKGVMCWREDDTHRDLLILSALALLTQPLPVIGLVLYACFVYERRMVQPGGVAFLKRFDFLFKQLNGPSHKFVLAILARNMFVAITPVVISRDVEIHLVVITFVITLYTVFQADWKPWKGSITNALDRAVSVVLILVGISGAMLRRGSYSKAQQTAAITMWIGFVIAALAFVIGTTSQIYIRLRTHKAFAFFLSHHKVGAGVTCRMMKEILMEYIRGKVFYDSDELDVISELYLIVAENTQSFVLVLSTETLKRLWCCVEVVAAVKFKLPLVVVSCDGASLPDDSFLAEDLLQVWTAPQWGILGSFGVDIDIVRHSYASLRSFPILVLKRFEPIGAMRELVFQVLKAACLRGFPVSSVKDNIDDLASVQAIVTGNPLDGEAVMTCHLLVRFIQRRVTRELAIVKRKKEIQCYVYAEWMLVVLTQGLLETCSFPALLAEAGSMQMMLLPIRASDSFITPTDATYAHMGSMTFDVPATVAITCYKALFNTIALSLSTLGSKAILEVESTLIAQRLVFSGDPLSRKNARQSDALSQVSVDSGNYDGEV